MKTKLTHNRHRYIIAVQKSANITLLDVHQLNSKLPLFGLQISEKQTFESAINRVKQRLSKLEALKVIGAQKK